VGLPAGAQAGVCVEKASSNAGYLIQETGLWTKAFSGDGIKESKNHTQMKASVWPYCFRPRDKGSGTNGIGD